QALGGAGAPRLAWARNVGDEATFARLTGRLVLAGAGLGVLGVTASALAGRLVLSVVFRPEFGAAAGVLLVLSVAAGLGFVASLLGYALTAARVLVAQAAVLSASLAVTLAGCALLVPRHGAVGAAWVLVLANLVQGAWNGAALRRLRRRPTAAYSPERC
ncbi:MAG TPA: hypothetical protein VFG59_02195, partial [Anaeromyxobacter sp.]|nr:hypothetical protein [Anaeromyxobacter sp.]